MYQQLANMNQVNILLQYLYLITVQSRLAYNIIHSIHRTIAFTRMHI